MPNSAAKTTKEQQKSGFKPGKSGNLNGRPHGSRNKATLALESLLEGEGEAITRKAIENALNGDMAAIRLCMERLIPLRKDRTVSFSLPEINGADDGAKAMAGVLRALADGDMTPIEASNVSGVIEIYRKTLETAEFEGRLKSLEQVTNHEKT
jgi:hypothetical protein